MKIDDLELTIRSSSALKNAGISTIEQLVSLDFCGLQQIKNAGEKSIAEICWSCVQLLNGNVLERAVEWDNKFPSRPDNWREIERKAKLYDHIEYLVIANMNAAGSRNVP